MSERRKVGILGIKAFKHTAAITVCRLLDGSLWSGKRLYPLGFHSRWKGDAELLVINCPFLDVSDSEQSASLLQEFGAQNVVELIEPWGGPSFLLVAKGARHTASSNRPSNSGQ
jgi:hypothetical protein